MEIRVSPRRIDQIRLDGGRPCLDFVNSIHDWYAPVREDYLGLPKRYGEWCLRAGVLTAAESELIDFEANGTALMRDVKRFRRILYDVFCLRIDGAKVPKEAVRELDGWLQSAWHGLTLDLQTPACLSWRPLALDGRLPIKRLALSALDVLTHAAPERLKRCASHGSCGWLFYDETKNNRRKWCSMQTCGAAAKMKRYRSRTI
jgi:predicted RNA-binding Zn ribbon-like protein